MLEFIVKLPAGTPGVGRLQPGATVALRIGEIGVPCVVIAVELERDDDVVLTLALPDSELLPEVGGPPGSLLAQAVLARSSADRPPHTPNR